MGCHSESRISLLFHQGFPLAYTMYDILYFAAYDISNFDRMYDI
ncbi:hypothetical protein GGQ08_003212 [Salinibacter ruber]|nr:hypothetical protein [Salinibacter ruber]MCS3655121.1 hypothetical protein [Salinibacter ruber]